MHGTTVKITVVSCMPLFLEFSWERTLPSQMGKDEAGRLKNVRKLVE
jgi:hypothetical protein